MRDDDLIPDRFADREFLMRRLLLRDPSFRTICEDYRQAAQANAFWRAKSASEIERADEYEGLVNELAAEIAARLDAAEPRLPSPPVGRHRG